MKVLVFAAHGFELLEFSAFVDVLGWARHDYASNVHVETVGVRSNPVSTFGIPITVSCTLDMFRTGERSVGEYDALAIPGGFEDFGFFEEAYSEEFLALIREFHRLGKVIATVCTGALPVAKSGILQGKKATTYHLSGGHRQEQLARFDVNVINERIVETDNIITSHCPETAVEVAFRLLERLTSAELTEQVKSGMGF